MPSAVVTVREVRAAERPQVIDLVRDVLAEFGLRFGEPTGSAIRCVVWPGVVAAIDLRGRRVLAAVL